MVIIEPSIKVSILIFLNPSKDQAAFNFKYKSRCIIKSGKFLESHEKGFNFSDD